MVVGCAVVVLAAGVVVLTLVVVAGGVVGMQSEPQVHALVSMVIGTTEVPCPAWPPNWNT